VGIVGKNAGVDLEEMAAMVGMLGDFGLEGGKAGVGIKNFLLGLTGKRNTGVFKKLGVDIADDKGTIRGVGDILKDVSTAVSGKGQQETMQVMEDIFGKIGMSASLALAGSADGLNAFIAKLRKSKGTVDGMVDTISDTTFGSIKELASAWEGFSIALTENGIFRDLVIGLSNIINKATTWIGANKKLAKAITSIAIVALPVITIIAGLVALLAPLVSLMVMVFSVGGIAVFAPMLIIGIKFLAVIVAIGVAIYLIYKGIRWLMKVLPRLVGELSTKYANVIKGLKLVFGEVFMFFKDQFTAIGAKVAVIFQKVKTIFKSYEAPLKKIIGLVFAAYKILGKILLFKIAFVVFAPIVGALVVIVGAFALITLAIKLFVKGLTLTIGIIHDVLLWLKEPFDAVFNAISVGIEELMKKISPLLKMVNKAMGFLGGKELSVNMEKSKLPSLGTPSKAKEQQPKAQIDISVNDNRINTKFISNKNVKTKLTNNGRSRAGLGISNGLDYGFGAL
jgi:hypothetical protein